MSYRTAIIGGGAAGFFSAIELKSVMPDMYVKIFERGRKVLSKVEISGGGRCNCTNSFAEVKSLSQVYPRGDKLLKRLFKIFGPRDVFEWFESHGVPLFTQDDNCVFPQAQDSHVIIDCFMREAETRGVRIEVSHKVRGIERVTKVGDFHGGSDAFLIDGEEFDFVIMTTGGMSDGASSFFRDMLGESIIDPIPSLFTFSINDARLHHLMGLVVENVLTSVPGTKFKSEGPLLITHWGVSGPAILRLSSYAARYLSERDYRAGLSVNWTGERNTENVRDYLSSVISENRSKMLSSYRPYNIQLRLWDYLRLKLGKRCRWDELGNKDVNRLTELLTNDIYQIDGKGTFKEEFVTCGGVALDAVNPNTMECKSVSGLFFAGEVLDIDGVTGGFNFQAAWTTAYVCAHGVLGKVNKGQ